MWSDEEPAPKEPTEETIAARDLEIGILKEAVAEVEDMKKMLAENSRVKSFLETQQATMRGQIERDDGAAAAQLCRAAKCC